MDIYNELKNVENEMSAIILEAADGDVHLANKLEAEKLKKLQGLSEILYSANNNGIVYMPFQSLVRLLAGVTFADFYDRAEEIKLMYKNIRFLDKCMEASK